MSKFYQNVKDPSAQSFSEINAMSVDKLLETEKINNRNGSWNKLDKTVRIQKLHAFAEKYGKQHFLTPKEVQQLKAFFIECLEKSKLQKVKDVIYNKDTREITSIPALFFNTENKNFTLRLDAKHVSTIKSLTPKKKPIVESPHKDCSSTPVTNTPVTDESVATLAPSLVTVG